jgi:addiction module HigA family antidote
MTERIPNIHPGEILKEDFLDPLEITPYRLARDLHVPPTRISEILKGRRRISADTALRLARYFDMTPQFWLNLQDEYDLEAAKLTMDPDDLHTIERSPRVTVSHEDEPAVPRSR